MFINKLFLVVKYFKLIRPQKWFSIFSYDRPARAPKAKFIRFGRAGQKFIRFGRSGAGAEVSFKYKMTNSNYENAQIWPPSPSLSSNND